MPEIKDIYADARTRMGKALEALENSLSTLRTGRANPGMLKKITVEYYNAQTPLDQVAQVTAPDARTLMIQPWDKNLAGAIERAIRDSDLGFNPNNRGDGIFITIPALNEERRKDLIKTAKGYSEDAKVAVRNIRREAIAEVDKLKKTLGEDEVKRAGTEVQKITDEHIKRVEDIFARKEQDILG